MVGADTQGNECNSSRKDNEREGKMTTFCLRETKSGARFACHSLFSLSLSSHLCSGPLISPGHTAALPSSLSPSLSIYRSSAPMHSLSCHFIRPLSPLPQRRRRWRREAAQPVVGRKGAAARVADKDRHTRREGEGKRQHECIIAAEARHELRFFFLTAIAEPQSLHLFIPFLHFIRSLPCIRIT